MFTNSNQFPFGKCNAGIESILNQRNSPQGTFTILPTGLANLSDKTGSKGGVTGPALTFSTLSLPLCAGQIVQIARGGWGQNNLTGALALGLTTFSLSLQM